MEPFHLTRGKTPLLLSVPHAGIQIPETVAGSLTDEARDVPDTDWHVDRLYDFAGELGAGMLVATHSRYVIDLNRDPDGQPLYPGADNTELCPTTMFDGQPIYRDGAAPDTAEIARRLTISIKTVETHASAVLRKLQLSSRNELAMWAANRRIV